MARVLVADDDEDIRDLVAACLAVDGHVVLAAADGQAAWDAMMDSVDEASGSAAYDVLVVDRMMPRLSGMELIRLCRQDPRTRDLPIVMLTARALPEEVEQGLNEGADRYLTKPFSPRDLRTTVTDLTSTSH